MSKVHVEDGTVGKDAELPTKVSFTEIIIVRHGETDWNAVKKIQGQSDVDLNEAGRQQAIATAERLSREPNISAVYSSDLKRALTTAEIIASKCGGLEVYMDKDLRDRHLGDLQGLTYQEASEVCPRALEAAKSSSSPDQEISGGGESRNQLHKRCSFSLQRIAEKHEGAGVIVVTHGLAIEMLYERALSGGDAGGVYNTSISIIHVFEGVWSIKSWSDISHLTKTQYLEPASASGGGGSSC